MARRNLNSPSTVAGDASARRRGAGGARHEASDRVHLRADGRVIEGWTLNASRGGVRVILEELLELGAVYELSLGDVVPPLWRQGKVVWVQDEADGQICGVKFLDSEEPVPPPSSVANEPPKER
ncbi:MAG TPA: PilZ domain-containing protein [Polyangiaceae bacterium]|nr:PilZ domain-containing protein [Polyangiaceae bacterium]